RPGSGVTVSLAADCIPGTSFTSSRRFCVAVAVREMRMTVQEALWSATRGGALSLRRDDIGHLAVGARADYAVLSAPSAAHLAYRPGVPLISRTSQPVLDRKSTRLNSSHVSTSYAGFCLEKTREQDGRI